jgi:hypothetical protein
MKMHIYNAIRVGAQSMADSHCFNAKAELPLANDVGYISVGLLLLFAPHVDTIEQIMSQFLSNPDFVGYLPNIFSCIFELARKYLSVHLTIFLVFNFQFIADSFG